MVLSEEGGAPSPPRGTHPHHPHQNQAIKRTTLSLSGAISHELMHLASSITASTGQSQGGISYNECLCVFLLSRQQVVYYGDILA